MKNSCRLGSWIVAGTLLAGCSDGASSRPRTAPLEESEISQTSQTLDLSDDELKPSGEIVPVARIQSSPSDDADDEADATLVLPPKNSPEWYILQITRLKVKPLGDDVDSLTLTPEKQADLRRERNQQVVDLATEAIARTHKDKSKQRVFDLAVHHLLEAELQLALAGDREHIDALYEHASSLYERDPKSKAAVEAGQTLIAFARLNAQRFGPQEPKWVEEYGRLVRQFAKNFPAEERQAIPMLLAAGQSCELHGLNADAIQCYATVREQFPKNSAVERVTPILRRLNLKGQPLKLAGPTLAGGYFDAAEAMGKPLLVVFWTTQAQPFIRQLPALKDLLGQIDADRVNVISVNLDDDDNDSAVQTFLETNGLQWPTIFQTEPGKRGWNNPIATYYGIQAVPLYWLVSAKGIVVETANNVKHLEPLLSKLVMPKPQ